MNTRKYQQRFLLCAIASLLSGCAHLYDPIDESLTCLHCEVEATQTWCYLRDQYAEVAYPHHFGAGFRAGYVDVCRGGSGCPPTLPPKCYWGIWYRNASGRAKIVEWFNGFSAGAAVAANSGHQAYGQLVTASDVLGQCGCEQDVEYDLSDLGKTSSPLDGPPSPASDPWPSPVHPGYGSEPFHPAPDNPGFSGGPTSQPPFAGPAWGHSQSSPLVPPVPPAWPGPNGADLDDPSFHAVPSAPPQPGSSAAENSRLPFGHSLESNEDARDQPSERLLPPPPVRSDDEVPPLQPADPPDSSSARQDQNIEDAFRPITEPVIAPRNSSPLIPHNPDPWARPAPVEESLPKRVQPESPPSDAFPPLEDRFLPQRDQPAPVPAAEPNSAQWRGPSESLREAFSKIEQASHHRR